MGFFRKSQEPSPQTEQVRPDQVKRLARLIKAEHDAILFDAPGAPDFTRAKGLLKAALRNSSEAEIRAAYRAAHTQD